MKPTKRQSDPLGRSTTRHRYSRYLLSLAIAITGSVWPIQARSMEPILDSGRDFVCLGLCDGLVQRLLEAPIGIEQVAECDLQLARLAALGLVAEHPALHTGQRAGADVPQVYLKNAAGTRRQRLLGFERVELEAGASKSVSLTVDPRLLARFDAKAAQWHIAAGSYQLALAKAADAPVLTADRAALRPHVRQVSARPRRGCACAAGEPQPRRRAARPSSRVAGNGRQRLPTAGSPDRGTKTSRIERAAASRYPTINGVPRIPSSGFRYALPPAVATPTAPRDSRVAIARAWRATVRNAKLIATSRMEELDHYVQRARMDRGAFVMKHRHLFLLKRAKPVQLRFDGVSDVFSLPTIAGQFTFDPAVDRPLVAVVKNWEHRPLGVFRRSSSNVRCGAAVSGRVAVACALDRGAIRQDCAIDAGSSNSTKRNGVRLLPKQSEVLQIGDKLEFGSLELELYDAERLHQLLASTAGTSVPAAVAGRRH